MVIILFVLFRFERDVFRDFNMWFSSHKKAGYTKNIARYIIAVE